MVALAKRRRDDLQEFYTNCNHITSYMVGLLDLSDSSRLLEPCAGDGAFVDQIIAQGFSCKIKLIDLNYDSVDKLCGKYSSFNNIEVEHDDFALQTTSEKYDRIIANPPYGAYQTPEKRKQLKKMYPLIYAKETYGIFLVRALEMLEEKGRMVFIIPDTYLTLHMHEGLRTELIEKYTIESIALFPSTFFPGVNFGYAGLSIISILKAKPIEGHDFPIYDGLDDQSQLPQLLEESDKTFEICRLTYTDIKRNPSVAFYATKEKWVADALKSNAKRISDICSVVTGFYSGNDGKYLKRAETVNRGIKKYLPIKSYEINHNNLSVIKPLDGISGENHWVPIVKGGNRRFHKPSEWFMDWSKIAINDYKVINKKKARFQNSQFYFCFGIAIPMVSSSSITGALIDGRLFDQSIVGVFPDESNENLLLYLLGFFNSSVCNTLIRTINASTNNSSNYIKKLPVFLPDDSMIKAISETVTDLLSIAEEREVKDADLKILNSLFETIYGVSKIVEAPKKAC